MCNAGKPVPKLVMVVMYHGAREWGIPTTFAGLYEDCDESDKLSLNFGYILVDVARIAPESMPEHAALRAGLLALKHSQLSELRPEDAALLAEAFDRTDEHFRKVTLTYVLRAFRGKHRGTVLDAAFENSSENRKMYQTIADKLTVESRLEGEGRGIVKGKREGIIEGREIGLREAKAQTLVLLLSQRFGSVSDVVAEHVRKAQEAQLDAWLRRVIGAARIEDVFADS